MSEEIKWYRLKPHGYKYMGKIVGNCINPGYVKLKVYHYTTDTFVTDVDYPMSQLEPMFKLKPEPTGFAKFQRSINHSSNL